MPVADVSSIIMSRNPVEEAQKWKELSLRKKELEMKQEEYRKKTQPKPYDFQFNEYGSENPYQQEFISDLYNKDVNLTMADADLLSIDYRDMDRCPPGSDCQRAWKAKLNRQRASQVIEVKTNQTKAFHEDLRRKISENPGMYKNAKNLELLKKYEIDWKKGNEWDYSSDGRLMISQNVPLQVPMVANGKPVYEAKEGVQGDGTTLDSQQAKLDTNGNPIPVLVESEDQFEKVNMTVGDWFTSQNYGQVYENKMGDQFTWGDFSKEIRTDDNNQLDMTASRNAMVANIFSGEANWDDEVGDGYLPPHATYIPQAMRNAQDANGDPLYPADQPITKQQIVDFSVQMAYDDYMQKYRIQSQKLKTQQDVRNQEEQENLKSLFNTIETTGGNLSYKIPESDEVINVPYNNSYDLDLSKKDKITTKEFHPRNTTLLQNDDVFRNLDQPMATRGDQVNFEFNTFSNFYYNKRLGRFLNQKDIDNGMMDDKDTILKTGAVGRWVSDDPQILKKWSSLNLTTGSEGGIDAILDADLVRNASSQEGPEGSDNKAAINHLYRLAEEWENTNANQSGSGGFDPNDY